jgi:hypothetical protein
MTGHATHGKCVRVVNLSPQNATSPGTVLRRRDASSQRLGQRRRLLSDGEEARLLQSERVQEAFLTECVQRPPRDLLDQGAEHDEVQVAIDRGLAGFVHQRRTADALEDRFARCGRPKQALAALSLALEECLVERPPRLEPGGVGEQVPERHAILATFAEGGEMLRNRVVEVDPPFVHEE